ncbi:MAG: ABC transporter permease, partial [Anaerolineae bacterium]
MILKYIFKNFTRRKVRTILMILSLLVSTGLIVAMSATVETVRRSNVDLIASAVGRYDLAVSKTEISPNQFLPAADMAATVLAADDRITAVYPRFHIPIEMNSNGRLTSGTLIALDNAVDDIGYVDVVEGAYEIGAGTAVLLESTALDYGLNVGDVIDVAYDFPQPREEGKVAVAGTSRRRAARRFTITGIVRQDGVVGADVRSGLIADLSDVQTWLDLPDMSQLLVAEVDPALYETNNAETAALRVRNVARNVQDQLGGEFVVTLGKASFLDQAAQGFLAIQALINTYGLIALGVVGLLVHTLVMTNVQEQRRDMAVLRILGGQRNFLFKLVIVEVLVIGVIGVTLGVGLGRLITAYIVVPLIENQMAQQGISSPLTPQVTLTAVLPAIISAFTVLIISSIKPAQDAANTKVMHAINPGVADNIQIEDLAHLRERQRTLAQPYYEVLRFPGLVPGGMVDVLTIGGLARRMAALFWPLVAGEAGFSHPDRPPTFLNIETAQYHMSRIVRPLLDQGLFEGVALDRNRLYSQILDNLNKAAFVGFPHTEIGARLSAAWVDGTQQRRIYVDVQTCASRFREYCLQNNLLDFSLVLHLFSEHLWPSPLCYEHLTGRYRHLLADNVEEDTPVTHDILLQWLPDFESALLICDWEAGFRMFLGADPDSALRLRDFCPRKETLAQSF